RVVGVGEAGARVGVDVVLLDLPGRVVVLLGQDLGDLGVGGLTEEAPGAAVAPDQEGEAEGEQEAAAREHTARSALLATLTSAPARARSAQLFHERDPPSERTTKQAKTAHPLSAAKSSRLEARRGSDGPARLRRRGKVGIAGEAAGIEDGLDAAVLLVP